MAWGRSPDPHLPPNDYSEVSVQCDRELGHGGVESHFRNNNEKRTFNVSVFIKVS